MNSDTLITGAFAVIAILALAASIIFERRANRARDHTELALAKIMLMSLVMGTPQPPTRPTVDHLQPKPEKHDKMTD